MTVKHVSILFYSSYNYLFFNVEMLKFAMLLQMTVKGKIKSFAIQDINSLWIKLTKYDVRL